MTDWIDAAYVAAHVDVDGVNAASLDNAVAAAVAYVQKARSDLPWGVETEGVEFAPDAAVKLGTAMLAWRLYTRKDAPLGVVTTPSGDPALILYNDPDISRLLGVGSEAGGFVFGAPARSYVNGYRLT